MAKSLWGGRFSGKTDPIMEAFNASIHFDKRLWKADINGSKAYANALAQAGIISEQESQTLVHGLEQVGQEWEQGTFVIQPTDEDIHTANERRLGEFVGSVSGKLHTGRSRNDQVATDMRLWLVENIHLLVGHLKAFVNVLVSRAESEMDVLMPGYTHLQRAQPIRWSHWLLSYASSWKQDIERLLDLLKRTNQMPLGSGALAGHPFNLDRHSLAQSLKFDGIMMNSLHAVSDRDFVAEFLFVSSLIMTHLSRWSEDLIVYASAEFGFVKLSDAYSTGSSLMPQKKNPDSLELIRGKCGRVFGDLSGFLMTYKGLPSTYNKDLQEDKEPMFDALDTVSGCIQIATGVISTLEINSNKMQAALSVDMLATDLADFLVRRGVPFRETHHIAGRVVAEAEKRGVSMNEIPFEFFTTLHPQFSESSAEELEGVWSVLQSVENRSTIGGTGKSSVLEQIRYHQDFLNSLN